MSRGTIISARAISCSSVTSLPGDLCEAAKVDGANALQRFRTLTLPLLCPTTYLILMLRAMGEVQTFEQINGLTRGGPGTATQTLAVYAYRRSFRSFSTDTDPRSTYCSFS
ncbi:MAG: sugar ABC transporter permease [Alphaproteobacteria bacterium]|nr:sugar ABC transporter permease [Alphaproteobacteria bacterium]